MKLTPRCSVFLQPMTLPNNSSDRSARSDLRPISTGVNRCRPVQRASQLSPQNMSLLRSELIRQPEIRPEVVARGRMLAADPNYPRFDDLRVVAAQILRARDLSEDDL